MSFAGLQKRLQKKATGAKATTTTASSSSDVNVESANPTTSIYEAAVQEVRTNHHTERKRQRSPHDDTRPTLSIAVNEDNTPCALPPVKLNVEKMNLKNLTELEFLGRRSLAEEVLLRCAGVMSRLVGSTPLLSSSSDADKESNASCVSALPLPLCEFLGQRLQCSSDALVMSTAACEEEEYNLFCLLKVALEKQCDEHARVLPRVEALVTILRVFWLVLCWHWVMTIRGTDVGTSYESGWSYNAYLLSRHALPSAVRNTRGREVALALEACREAYRVRQNVLDFLAYVLHDVEVALRHTEHKGQSSEEEARIVPMEIVDTLFRIVQHLRRRDFAACRQLYVDLTMGTANWKLGLFSGGEVHMRRSMERIERRRIEHLLHNERAIRLLHALRELVDFVQRHETSLGSSGIFTIEK